MFTYGICCGKQEYLGRECGTVVHAVFCVVCELDVEAQPCLGYNKVIRMELE